METILKGVEALNSYLQIVIMVLIFGTGIMITIKTRCLQVRRFGYSLSMTLGKTIKSIEFGKKDKKKDKNKISPFAAFSAAVAGTVGTGNIVGVTTAIITGGPGAIFWMWFSAFFGMVTNYSENTLGIYFRDKNEKGEWRGGAMYYIVRGIGKSFKWLAIIFASCAVLASVGFNFAQSNSITNTLTTTFNTVIPIPTIWIKVIFGSILMIVAGLVIVGGIKRISTVSSFLVPFMAILYIILALIIICMNITNVPHSIALIFTEAFKLKSVFGGVLGYGIMKACRYGVARGIFSNEAGLGSSVMAHSSADVKEPVEQGLWGVFEVFLDTFIICTLTSLVILSSGAFDEYVSLKEQLVNDSSIVIPGATDLCLWAFKGNLGIFGQICFCIILPLFAFTTLVSWSYYGEKAIEYLFGYKVKTIYRFIYVALIIAGSTISADLVWELADTFNFLMAIPNLIALVILSGLIAKISKNYFDRRKGAKIDPLISFDSNITTSHLAELLEEDEFALVSEGGPEDDIEGEMIAEMLAKEKSEE